MVSEQQLKCYCACALLWPKRNFWYTSAKDDNLKVCLASIILGYQYKYRYLTKLKYDKATSPIQQNCLFNQCTRKFNKLFI